MNAARMQSRYVSVQDDAGNKLVRPLNERDDKDRRSVDSEDCIESEVAGRYAGRLKIVDAVR